MRFPRMMGLEFSKSSPRSIGRRRAANALLALCLTACGSDSTPSPAPSDASIAPDTLAADTNPCATVEGLSCACGASLGTWRCAGVMPVCVCATPDVQTADDRESTDTPDTAIACDVGVYCPTTGGCVNTLISAAHCGGCGNRCVTGRVCVDGSCVLAAVDAGVDARVDAVTDVPRDIDLNVYTSCRTQTDCNGSLDDGCEVDLSTSPQNCGGCGLMCGGNIPRHVLPACRAGVCGGVCAPGWWDCDRNAANGCESDRAAMMTAESFMRGACRTVP